MKVIKCKRVQVDMIPDVAPCQNDELYSVFSEKPDRVFVTIEFHGKKTPVRYEVAPNDITASTRVLRRRDLFS